MLDLEATMNFKKKSGENHLRDWTLKRSRVMHNFVGEKGESQVYFVKASKLETQHDILKILLTHY